MPSIKNANPISPNSPSALRQSLKSWIEASRPKTLIAGISPVCLAACVAVREIGVFSWPYLILCLLFSLVLQIATNWANDYFDFIKGADTAARSGPRRAVQAGLIAPLTMYRAALIGFTLALLIALPLLWQIGFVFFPLALTAIACGFFYTGGKRPLGYLGLGELLVFLFYGPVAVCGTLLVLTSHISLSALLTSIVPGALSCAILTANNLRDAKQDRTAGKLTLIARFGKRFGQIEYAIWIALALLFAWKWAPLLLLLSLRPLKIVFKKEEELKSVLPLTAKLLVIYTLCFALETLLL